MPAMEKQKDRRLIDVAHVSLRGTSARITLPKKISKRLSLKDGDIVAFYDDDAIVIDKLE